MESGRPGGTGHAVPGAACLTSDGRGLAPAGPLPGRGPGRRSAGRRRAARARVEAGLPGLGHQGEQLRAQAARPSPVAPGPASSWPGQARPARRGAAAGRPGPARAGRTAPRPAPKAGPSPVARSAALIASQLRVTSSAPDTVTVAEHVRVPPDQLGHDAVGHVVHGEPGAVGPLGGDPGVEHHLEQDITEFLAQRRPVAAFQRVQRLVGLLDQVGRQRLVRLPGVPRAPAGAGCPSPTPG